MDRFTEAKLVPKKKKHPHALHFQALALEHNQTNPVVRKLTACLEDMTDHLQAF